jgi:hypothetical protein
MSDENEKQIMIDPSLFEISSSKTRRQKPAREKIPKLKLRQPTNPTKIDHTLKSHALKFLRNKQLNLHQSRLNSPEPVVRNRPSEEETLMNNFDSSIQYLSSIQKKTPTTTPVNRHAITLRSPTPQPPPSIFDAAIPVYAANMPITDETDIRVEPDDDIFSAAQPVQYTPPPHKQMPKYGCLKNGSLPTYRSMNRTVRNTFDDIEADEEEKPTYREWLRKNTEMRKVREHRENANVSAEKQKRMAAARQIKQKKTVRRTYHVGKSLNNTKVSVLVSNRTIRRDIDKKCNELKQMPIEEVRKTLLKKGIIKVGTIAPNDVLRKMYESLGTICGDVKNHNSDNLVFNYFNDDNTHVS